MKKAIRKIKRLFKRVHNFFFCLKYPFWKIYNVWSGKFGGYDWTMYDAIPIGWRKAFGKQFSIELKAALIKDNQLRSFRFTDIKEKYGTLRLHHSGAGKNTDYVLSRFEFLSRCYCIDCGKPARYITSGWVEFLCEECGKNTIKAEYLSECRLTKNDIPILNIYEKGQSRVVNVEEYYNIDFIKLWGLDEKD